MCTLNLSCNDNRSKTVPFVEFHALQMQSLICRFLIIKNAFRRKVLCTRDLTINIFDRIMAKLRNENALKLRIDKTKETA